MMDLNQLVKVSLICLSRIIVSIFVLEDADHETLTTASVSRVAAVFDQITESMIQEAQNQAMQLIQKTENELNEKFLKT